MKKILTILLFSICIFCLFAGNTPANDKKTVEQKISGYIDDITFLSISNFAYDNINEGKGINLNYTDESNTVNRYLITPTSEILTLPGLPIGTFSLIATFTENQSGGRLTITHDKLVNSSDPSVEYDYELGIKYSLNNGNTILDVPAKMCLSRNSTITSISGQKSVVINLPGENGIVSIQDAGIYFRLTKDSIVSVTGQYFSTVTFNLEAI